MNPYFIRAIKVRASVAAAAILPCAVLMVLSNSPFWGLACALILYRAIHGLSLNFASYELRSQCEKENPELSPEERLELYSAELCCLNSENKKERTLGRIVTLLSLLDLLCIFLQGNTQTAFWLAIGFLSVLLGFACLDLFRLKIKIQE